MFYDRAIHYLNVYRNGEKGSSCGFLKLEQRGKKLTYRAEFACSFSGEIKAYFLQTSGKMMQRCVTVNNGKAVLSGSFLTEEGWADSHFDGIVFEIGKDYVIQSIWNDETEGMVAASQTPIPDLGNVSAVHTENRKEESKELFVKKSEEIGEEQSEKKEERVSAAEAPEIESVAEEGIAETKWEQLWKLYPHKKPFEDQREYLMCSPADFVLLSEESYKKANNTFLVHGFYTYGHLLLGKREERGKIQYFLAVPGTYVEKESKMAVYFGFDSFEAKEEPAEIGDFGYYCLTVAL